MKKMKCILLLTLCIALLMTGCATTSQGSTTTAEPTAATTVEPTATAEPTATPESTATTEPTASNSESTDGRVIYAEQIARYATALSEQWDLEKYYDNDMCEMVESYYEGNPMENVGVAFPDLDFDGKPELVIGAIYNSDNDPAIFEIWTTDADGTPKMLAQSHSRARYYLDYDEADMWFVSYEASYSAFIQGCYYYTLSNGSLALMQAIIYDGNANPDAPWYMADDEDWDVSNDSPIDEATYNGIWESHSNRYEVFDYTPYSEL